MKKGGERKGEEGRGGEGRGGEGREFRKGLNETKKTERVGAC